MRPSALVPIMLSILTLAGCSGDGGQGGDQPKAPVSSVLVVPTPSAALPSSEPVYAESATCRSKMAPLIDIMLANAVNNLDYPTFHDRFEELQRKMKGALLACSDDVSRPATRVVYEYSLANLAWGYCTDKHCASALIRKHLVEGTTLAYKVKDQVEEST